MKNIINIVVPMAGRGQRFIDNGYSTPKPLLKINDKYVMSYVIKNMKVDGARFIFLVRKDHVEEHQIDKVLKEIEPTCEVIIVDKITEGAMCTVLLAKDLINTEEEVVIANCDQIVDWTASHFFKYMRKNKADGGIVTVYSDNPAFSFAKVDRTRVTSVAEKIVISNHGTVGIYYFARGKDLVKYAEGMIKKNIRTNNEFYVCPVYNQFILDHKTILNYPIPEMYCLGTPIEFEKNKDRATLF